MLQKSCQVQLKYHQLKNLTDLCCITFVGPYIEISPSPEFKLWNSEEVLKFPADIDELGHWLLCNVRRALWVNFSLPHSTLCHSNKFVECAATIEDTRRFYLLAVCLSAVLAGRITKCNWPLIQTILLPWPIISLWGHCNMVCFWI